MTFRKNLLSTRKRAWCKQQITVLEGTENANGSKNNPPLDPLAQGINYCVGGTIALNTFSGQLWYLSEGLVALAFFDQEVPDDMKRRMVAALDKDGDEDPLKRALQTCPKNPW